MGNELSTTGIGNILKPIEGPSNCDISGLIDASFKKKAEHTITYLKMLREPKTREAAFIQLVSAVAAIKIVRENWECIRDGDPEVVANIEKFLSEQTRIVDEFDISHIDLSFVEQNDRLEMRKCKVNNDLAHLLIQCVKSKQQLRESVAELPIIDALVTGYFAEFVLAKLIQRLEVGGEREEREEREDMKDEEEDRMKDEEEESADYFATTARIESTPDMDKILSESSCDKLQRIFGEYVQEEDKDKNMYAITLMVNALHIAGNAVIVGGEKEENEEDIISSYMNISTTHNLLFHTIKHGKMNFMKNVQVVMSWGVDMALKKLLSTNWKEVYETFDESVERKLAYDESYKFFDTMIYKIGKESDMENGAYMMVCCVAFGIAPGALWRLVLKAGYVKPICNELESSE